MAIGALLGVAGGIASIAGGLIGAGKKVRIPEYQGIDPTQIQKDTALGAIKSMPEAEKSARLQTEANMRQIQAMLDIAIPGGLKPVQASTAALLRGEIPADVQSSVLRSGAARQLGMGVPGTAFGANLTLRDLGLTSLQAQQQGFQQFGALSSLFAPGVVSPSNMFLNVQQRAEIAMHEADMRWKQQLMQAEVAAQPEPWKAALGGSLQAMGGAMMGGAIGGMFGGGGGGGSTIPQTPPYWAAVGSGGGTGGMTLGGYSAGYSSGYGGPVFSGGY